MVLFLLFAISGYSQIDQQRADSLKVLYREFESKETLDSSELATLYHIAYWESSFDSVLFYASVLVDRAFASGDFYHHHRGLLLKGTIFKDRGNSDQALNYFMEAEGVAKRFAQTED